MRFISAASFALAAALAAMPLLAQKPGAEDPSDPDREYYRGQGIAMCVAEMQPVAEATPDDVEAICGCAFERFLPGRQTQALPPLAGGRVRATMARELLACTVERDARLAPAVALRLAEPPTVAEPPAFAPPQTDGGTAPHKPAAAPAIDPGAWFDGLSWPRWLTGSGLPRWAWIALLALAFVFLRALLRRRDARADLMGPPRSMRLGARPSQPPRLDPPPRR